jgi:hypothetical protein
MSGYLRHLTGDGHIMRPQARRLLPMRLSSPRVPPIDPETLQGEPREILDRSQLGGRTLNIFATLIHHPKLMKRWQVFGNHVLNKSTLPPRDRELLISCASAGCAAPSTSLVSM